MLKKSIAVVALATLAACGDGDSDSPTRSTPPATFTSMQGLWTSSQMWLTQFNRTHDNFNGSYTCPGNLTINHDPASSTFSGFAVVAAPCPPLSFDLTGSIDASRGVRITMRGPRPGAGSCPQFPSSTYTGSYVGNTLSIRASATVLCPGPGDGEHTFNIILTANKSVS